MIHSINFYSVIWFPVYNAVGLCAFGLYDQLDYDTWYQTQLLKELTITDPRYSSLACSGLPPFTRPAPGTR